MSEVTNYRLEVLVQALGEVDAARLVERLGGTRWHMPVKGPLPEGHLIVEVLGAEAGEKLRVFARGETVQIPRDRQILERLVCELYEQGRTLNELVLLFKRDVRNIQRAIARHRARQAAGRQAELFS